ncbi:MAG: type VI secretion protein IcmF/TssM N-terminal domain-containing protein [Planctomycetota bacterium]
MAEQPDAASNDAGADPPGPVRSRGVSIAGLASCLTGLVLLAIFVLAVIAKVTGSPLTPSGLEGRVWPLIVAGLLVLVIPIVVFRAVTLWMMGDGPKMKDIEYSWRAGIDAMAQHGITPKSAPLFLIIGGGSDKLRRNLMAASGIDFPVNGVPNRPAPLHWYANRKSIYLFLDDAACMNLAARRQRSGPPKPGGRPMPSDAPAGGGAKGPLATLSPDSPTPPAGKADGMETIAPGDGPQAPAAARPVPRYAGTLMPTEVAAPVVDAAATVSAAETRRGRRASSDEASAQLRRLEAVCTKLRQSRDPVCPVNGMLVLLPLDLLQATQQDVEDVERAISADLTTLQRELQLRCPVFALVVAMEQERGFCELIRRIGAERASSGRIGRKFDTRIPPTQEQLEKYSLHAAGIFEEWVYTLFREDNVLSHHGNPALYNLLCKVRRSFQARLSDVLSKGFGYRPEEGPGSMLFGGCYFAATGSKPERQAFVGGVLRKLREEQEDLEWTGDALQANTRRGRLALAGWLLSGLLVLATVAIVILADR